MARKKTSPLAPDLSPKEGGRQEGGAETTPALPFTGARGPYELALLAFTLLLALALRLVGITWGLPNALHLFSYHPDESLMVSMATPDLNGLNIFAGKFLTHYYDYGALQFYLINIAVLIGEAYHLIGPISPHGQIDAVNWAHAYMAGRLLSVVMGVGTVWAVYALGRRLWGAPAGLIAGLLLAVMPLHAQHSHFATVDIGAAFWATLSLVWTARLLSGDPKEIRAAALSGLFAGLTASTKYIGILVLLSVAAALAIRLRAGNLAFPRAVILGIAAIAAAAAAFVVTCPGCLLETGVFVAGIRKESDHVMRQGEIYFQGTGMGWVYIVARNLDAGMGLPLLIVSLGALMYCCWKRDQGGLMLAAFAVPFYLILGAAQSRYARYEMALLPILALWAGKMIADWLVAKPGGAPNPAKRGLGTVTALALALGVFTLADCLLLLQPMWQTDPRDRAAEWLAAHAPAPAVIGFGGQPWFWTAAVNPYFAAPGVKQWRRYASAEERARYCFDPNQVLDAALLTSCKAPFVTISEYEYYDPLRLRQSGAQKYVNALREQYNDPIIFAAPHPLGGYHDMDGLPIQDLPTDMLYPSPTILVYTRRGRATAGGRHLPPGKGPIMHVDLYDKQ